MLLKIRQRIFLNDLVIEIQEPQKSRFKAFLKDDHGIVCSALEMETEKNQSFYKWNGLNELPYGVYTCEILGEMEETKTQLVKRI
jgi:hypothetical protein